MPQIVVHHLDNSRSQRILWLLEELGLPYEIRLYKRDHKTRRAPPELLAVHPLGKAPVVTVDDVVLAESGAILETLVEDFGAQLCPPRGGEAHRRYRYFLHYAEGSLAPVLLVATITARIARASVPFFVKPVVRRIAASVDANYTTPELERHFSFLEQGIAGREWFAGDAFSAADIQLSFGIEAAMKAGYAGERPQLAAWLTRIHARPAWQRAIERGGPYVYA